MEEPINWENASVSPTDMTIEDMRFIFENYGMAGNPAPVKWFDEFMSETLRKAKKDAWEECAEAIEKQEHLWNSEERLLKIIVPSNPYKDGK